jgi:hypothetical protein
MAGPPACQARHRRLLGCRTAIAGARNALRSRGFARLSGLGEGRAERSAAQPGQNPAA